MKLIQIKRTLILAATFLMANQIHAVDASKQLEVNDDTFACISELEHAGGNFFVSNLLGDNAATLAVAQSDNGGEYPAGSVISMVPTEVMIKHQEGWNPETNDWEFFELTVSEEGSTIKTRGTTDVINQFGGNCLDCHKLAKPEWDFICASDHGCAPLPIQREQILAIQQADPRCAKKD